METIRESWASYMDDVIPKDAPTVQIQECKRAFVGGVQALLAIVLEIGDDHVSEDAAVKALEGISDEC